ncbi:MAG: phosphatidate cytidylyltransferase [Ruminococcus sp.]|nr:phosphatidate cytidylyltransferase [Ruminococcus sp.]
MKTRIISAAVAIAIAIVVLALAHTWVFNLAIAAITVGALYELFKAFGLVKYKIECAVCFTFAAIDCLIGMVQKHNFFTFFNVKLYGFLFVIAIMLLYLKNHNEYSYVVPFSLIGATLIVAYSFHTLLWLVEYYPDFGVFATVLTLAGAWLADSGAYFAGTFFGKHKLCPEISPKKTVEGVIGGAVCNGLFLLIIAAIYGGLINKDADVHLGIIFIAGILCSIIGLIGDLTASEIKRQAGIKDYGNIMPGHGGIMDRFDSVLMVAPFMYWMFSQGWLVAV